MRPRPTPTPNMADRTRRSTDALALIAFCGFLFVLGLQIVGLLGADEPRYAQVAREMLARHDWVTPVLYGHPWLEKPPLYYWGAMLAYKGAGGVSDTAARLPTAVLTSLLIIFIYGWARRFRPGMQLDAALITASAAIVVGFGRSASTDMPLTVMFTIAMLLWYGWYASQKRAPLLAFYVFLALATLAKGPVAIFLAAVIILLFAALRRDGRLLLRTLSPIGIALYLAVAAPWFIAVQHANPEFFRTFFLQHNLERFGSNLYHHPQPFWFYVPVTLLALVPWTVFVVAAVVDAIRDWRFSTEQPAGQEDLRTYLAIWFLVPVIFFSLSHSKLPGYILPAIPAGTILLADFIWRREQKQLKPSMWMIALHALLSAALLIASFVVSFKLLKLALPRTVIIVAASLAIITIVMYVITLHSQGYRVLRFTTLVPVVIAFSLLLRGTAPMINYLLSERPVAVSLSQTEIGRLPDIAVYDVPPGVEYGLAFYRNHPVMNYERNEIPPGDHIVIAAQGSQKELQYRLPGRKVVLFGGFTLQHLDFYLIAGKPVAEQRP
ncbi:MAG TPA: glycosyltransferase family 39 protein [Verrucomicrobiae bacterium]|nr:glycosyltransferase family 39 protein [Verrucomicrobiae bacterium]